MSTAVDDAVDAIIGEEMALEAAKAEEKAAVKTQRKARATPPTAAMFDLSSIAPIEKPRSAVDKFSAVLYAPPKIGKTSLVGTCADVPELAPVLILATEDGTSVLAGQYDEDLDVINCEDYPTAGRVIVAVAEGKTKYKTFAIDTISELQELMKEHTNETGYGLWAFVADETIKVVKLLHRSPHVNVIFTTHAEKVKDENSGKLLTSPYFLGKKSLGEILKPVDLILYLAVTDVEGVPTRVLLTKPDGKNDAGDRTGKLDMYIPNPNFAEIYAQLQADPAADAE
jgi:hypothetical protein